jgi:putative protease
VGLPAFSGGMVIPIPDNRSTRMPELMAPAGSRDALVAAVAAGADAVYLGGKQFNARRFAGNFDERGLREALAYAHLRGVRVYVTVNTLVHDRELPGLSKYLLWLYEHGADAILVQDTGVAALARELVPGLPLHASTQMTIYDRNGVAMASRKGFSRVVIAREVSLDEISAITRDPACIGTGIEVFVHGALCYCYSGQCLLSSVIGGRSGNRGTCAQPCRKPYRLVAGAVDRHGRPESLLRLPIRDQYLLSTRDLSLYPHLDRLAKSGITAMKIEGRMRSPAYVAIVISIYRKALDAIATGSWEPTLQDEQDLALAFNRGFTTGYLSGATPEDVMGRDRQDNRGLFIGTVDSWSAGAETCRVRLSGPVSPEPGDGIVIIDTRTGREEGMVLTSAPVAAGGWTMIPLRGRFPRGSAVYITRRAELLRRADAVCAGERKSGFLPIDLLFRVGPDRVPVIDCATRGKDGIPISISWHADAPLVPAISAPLNGARIGAQMKKAGDSVFSVRHCTIEYPGGLFTPLGILNRMRRAALFSAEEAVVQSWMPDPAMVASAQARLDAISPKLIAVPARGGQQPGSGEGPGIEIYVDSVDGAREAVRNGCRIVCFEPDVQILRNHDPGPEGFPSLSHAAFVTMMEEYTRICRDGGAIPVWKWPPVTRGGFLERLLPLIQPVFAAGVEEILLDNLGSAGSILRIEPRMRLSGGTGLNVFNHRSARALSPHFQRLTLSPELTSGDIRELLRHLHRDHAPEIACIVQGNLEVMVSEDDLPGCIPDNLTEKGRYPFMGILDERERIFPVRRDSTGHTRIRNAVETCLIDHLPTLIEAGIGIITIDAGGRGSHYAGEMTRIYREAIQAYREGSWKRTMKALKGRIQDRALGGITAGAFLHGLKEEGPAVPEE